MTLRSGSGGGPGGEYNFIYFSLSNFFIPGILLNTPINKLRCKINKDFKDFYMGKLNTLFPQVINERNPTPARATQHSQWLGERILNLHS